MITKTAKRFVKTAVAYEKGIRMFENLLSNRGRLVKIMDHIRSLPPREQLAEIYKYYIPLGDVPVEKFKEQLTHMVKNRKYPKGKLVPLNGSGIWYNEDARRIIDPRTGGFYMIGPRNKNLVGPVRPSADGRVKVGVGPWGILHVENGRIAFDGKTPHEMGDMAARLLDASEGKDFHIRLAPNHNPGKSNTIVAHMGTGTPILGNGKAPHAILDNAENTLYGTKLPGLDLTTLYDADPKKILSMKRDWTKQ